MSGGFFRGTSADQDTRFSNKQAKLMKSQKFAPELEHLVDVSKVKMDVMKPWIANRVTELIGFEDEVLINFIYGLLDGKGVNGKEVQISLTGFMERNTGKFMKELWSLLLSAQKNVSGVPQQFLDDKEEETKKKKAELDRIANEIQKRRDKESQELEQERKEKMDRGYSLKDADRGEEPGNRHERRSSAARPIEDREFRGKNGSRGRSSEGRRSRSLSPFDRRERSSSSERLHRNSPRQFLSPRGRRSPHRYLSPSRRSPYSRRKSTSRSDRRSPSPHHYRIRRKSRSPLKRRSRSPIWRRPRSLTRRSSPWNRSRSPIRRRSTSVQRKSPSPTQGEPLSPSRLRSPSPVRPKYLGSPSTRHRSRSPVQRRSRSPIRRRSRSPIRRRSRSPIRRRSRSPIRRRFRTPIRRRSRTPIRRRSPSPVRRRSRSPIRQRVRSPVRRRSPSPIEDRSLSPIRHRSTSPLRDESNSPSGSKSPRKSPKRANHKSPSQERSSASPIQSRSLSPGDGRSPKRLSRSPLQAPRGRISWGLEKRSPVHGTVARKAVESPKEARQRFNPSLPPRNSHRNSKRSSPSPHRSPSVSELERERHVIEKRGNQSEKLEHHKKPGEQEPQKVRDFLLSDKRMESPTKVRNRAGEKIESHSGDTRISKQHLEPLPKLPRKGIKDGRSPSVGSDSEDSDKDTAEVQDKRKSKRSGKRDLESDDESSYDSYAERKEAKRRKKEEKKLKKEEKRHRREERRRRKEEKRSGRHKLKSGGTVSTPSDTDGKHDDDFDVDQGVKRQKSGRDDIEEPLTEQKKLEIELREKAIELYMAKKGISH